MFEGFVETDTGEKMRFIRHDKTFGGKATLSFLTVLSEYCITKSHPSSADEEVTNWFINIEGLLGDSASEVFRSLEQAYYSGYWGDYTMDEREFFIKRTQLEVSQWQFEESIKSVKQRWTSLKSVLDSVRQLLSAFKEHNVQQSSWYNPKDTIPDFESLETILEILEKRGCSKVRLQFTI